MNLSKMKQLLLVLLLCCVTSDGLDWWEGGNFYQIYPRSFMDSDGDGVGDLKGIQSKVSYLKSLGVDGVWLSPIFKSPMADFGYDISDFRDINEEFGTMDDFDDLLAECKKQGVKLILDFVPNHSSDEHEWFKKSERREPGFEDYYVWDDGKVDPETGAIVPPNNWVSIFRFSSWKWSPIRNQFYYHAFLDKQPDLNYRNPKVVQEMKDVIDFWITKGVDGFRIDAVNFIFEAGKDPQGIFPDEPLSGKEGCNSNDSCYLNHIHTQDQEDFFDMIYQWRELMNNFQEVHGGDTKIIMTEAYTALENVIRLYGDGIRNGSHIPFNFGLLGVNIDSSAADYKECIDIWLDNMPIGVQANWVLGNHDVHRLATRLGVARGDLINILLQTLPGIAVTYQGEELVMEDVHISWEDTLDPQACNTHDPENYEKVSRDVCRTPFPWDETEFAGFTEGSKTWLPVGTNNKETNVKDQENAVNSHLKIYRKLLALRKHDVMRQGTYLGEILNDGMVFAYKRELRDNFVLVALNYGDTETTVDFKTVFPNIPENLLIYTSSLNSEIIDGESIDTSSVKVPSNMGIVLTNV